jgi:hypothetical protein
MLSTKGNTLKNIESKIQIFLVPKSIIFRVSEWRNKKINIINIIKKKFKKKIIFRSSTTFEDTDKLSAAGAFVSVLNINSNNTKEIIKSTEKVIRSYKKKNKNISNQQILVQEMIENIKMSGVIFTGDIHGNKFYYNINYDDVTGLTNTVTSGSSIYSNKTLYIYKKRTDLIQSNRFKLIVKATKELEKIFKDIPLDIEFGLNNKNKLFLFQVRPVVINNKSDITQNFFNKNLNMIYNDLKNSFDSKKKDINGKTTLFSQMTDWNPAEMIGQHPSNLSYSLYRRLITDHSWLKARKIMGYKYFKDTSLMHKFAGKPYIDIRKSINSFLPKSLNKKISNNLVDLAINELKTNPAIHDKIEFELVPTCFSFDLERRASKFLNNISNKDKILVLKNIKNQFIDIFLKNLPTKSPGSIFQNKNKINILKNFQNTPRYKINGNINNINLIINQTIQFGIIPFSILARHAFIAKDNLLSLVRKKILNKYDLSRFEKSISTVTSKFLNDQKKAQDNYRYYKIFIKKYGHLRAGTYDINSSCYSEFNKNIFLVKKIKNINLNNNKFVLSKTKISNINQLLKKNNININSHELFNYFRQSIVSREYAKFVFAKSINIILQNIKIFARKNKISLSDIEQLDINDISLLKKDNISSLLKIVKKNNVLNSVNQLIKLPEIIVDKSNAFIGASVVSIPNFVSNEIIDAEVIYFESKNFDYKIKNKIVLIDNADPGFDWIFGHKIKGLITKFGGANSHMTIRCNELNIPAAIGCGETMFQDLIKAKKLSLNCKNRLVKVISYK